MRRGMEVGGGKEKRFGKIERSKKGAVVAPRENVE